MNLLPVGNPGPALDAAASAVASDTALGTDAAPIDFAALMAGLMTGDPQIVPPIDPATEPVSTDNLPAAESETVEATDHVMPEQIRPLAQTSTALAHMANSPKSDQIGANPLATVHANPNAAAGLATAMEEPSGLTKIAPTAVTEQLAVTAPESEGVATVAALKTAETLETLETLETVTRVKTAETLETVKTAEAPVPIDPAIAGGLVAREPGISQTSAPKQPSVNSATSHTRSIGHANRSRVAAGNGATEQPTQPFLPVANVAGPGTSSHSENSDPMSVVGSAVEALTSSESAVSDDADPQTATADITRTAPTTNQSGQRPQAVMTSVARRVEQAIAALELKPDPRIVTLQLDELDGLRLTVAIRPDGVALSSDSDSSLVAEIREALDSRGFNMSREGRDDQDNRDDLDADDFRQMRPAARRRPNHASDSIAL